MLRRPQKLFAATVAPHVITSQASLKMTSCATNAPALGAANVVPAAALAAAWLGQRTIRTSSRVGRFDGAERQGGQLGGRAMRASGRTLAWRKTESAMGTLGIRGIAPRVDHGIYYR